MLATVVEYDDRKSNGGDSFFSTLDRFINDCCAKGQLRWNYKQTENVLAYVNSIRNAVNVKGLYHFAITFDANFSTSSYTVEAKLKLFVAALETN
jgi:hypothetical protein